jgi:hypothetical protein
MSTTTGGEAPQGDAPGAGAGPGGVTGPGAAPPAGVEAAPAAPSYLLAAAARPDWLEESFYDPEQKGIRVEALGQSYRELRGKFSQKTDAIRAELLAEQRRGVPETPDKYEVAMPSDGLPPGFEFAPPKGDDPLLTETRAVLHELGAKPEQFNRLVGALVQSQIAAMPNVEAERAKLGEGAPQRIAAVDAWLARRLDENEYRAVANGLTTADGILALEKMMKAAGSGEPGIQGGGGSGISSGVEAMAAEVREAMRHPDYYHQEKGKEMRAKADAFFAAGHRLPR